MRLEGDGLIDRSRRVGFSFDGRQHVGFEGDTLASALMGADVRVVARSFKYHRPRGPVASSAEEPNALLGLGQGGRFEPNQRATTTPLEAGMVAVSQNAFDALVSICYNIGPGAFAGSTFLKRINVGDTAGAYDAILMWKKPAAIITRRQAEAQQLQEAAAESTRRAEAVAAQLRAIEERTGADEAVRFHHHPVKHDRAHADQAVLADDAALVDVLAGGHEHRAAVLQREHRERR